MVTLIISVTFISNSDKGTYFYISRCLYDVKETKFIFSSIKWLQGHYFIRFSPRNMKSQTFILYKLLTLSKTVNNLKRRIKSMFIYKKKNEFYGTGGSNLGRLAKFWRPSQCTKTLFKIARWGCHILQVTVRREDSFRHLGLIVTQCFKWWFGHEYSQNFA